VRREKPLSQGKVKKAKDRGLEDQPKLKSVRKGSKRNRVTVNAKEKPSRALHGREGKG